MVFLCLVCCVPLMYHHLIRSTISPNIPGYLPPPHFSIRKRCYDVHMNCACTTNPHLRFFNSFDFSFGVHARISVFRSDIIHFAIDTTADYNFSLSFRISKANRDSRYHAFFVCSLLLGIFFYWLNIRVFFF